MPKRINKIFVYGTLLQGEGLCHYMSDCMLLQTLEIPGSLYDTNRGYPTAVFDEGADTCITGELYVMENPPKKIRELDELEMTGASQYNRLILNYNGMEFYTYEAGDGLKQYCSAIYQIDTGNWRRHSSFCFSNPAGFALAFEDRQKYLYREPVTLDADGLIYQRGETPVLICAPHSSVHERMGKLKRQEFYTGALAVMLHALCDCHVLYTNRVLDKDPNYYDDSSFKTRLSAILGVGEIKFLIDLHGTGPERDEDVYPGVGANKEFLLDWPKYFDELRSSGELNGISIGGEDVFPAAKQMTVTKYAARQLGVPSIQLEINRRLREPEQSPLEFVKLTKFLKDFIERLSNLIG